MTKIPLGIPDYSNLLHILFFIITKTIAIGITEIGQAKLKTDIFINVTNCAAAQSICAGAHRTFHYSVRLTNCATSDDLCDQIDH